jgi:hypothetical protein
MKIIKYERGKFIMRNLNEMELMAVEGGRKGLSVSYKGSAKVPGASALSTGKVCNADFVMVTYDAVAYSVEDCCYTEKVAQSCGTIIAWK